MYYYLFAFCLFIGLVKGLLSQSNVSHPTDNNCNNWFFWIET